MLATEKLWKPSKRTLYDFLKDRIIEGLAPEEDLEKLSLFDFFQQAWRIIEPGRPIKTNWHQELICEYLECVSKGEIKRLLINIAPRHLKSTIVTVVWPCWEWIHRPELRYLTLSYSQRLSTDHSVKRRFLIQSEWYQSRWGNVVSLAKDNNQKTEFSNSMQGRMFASSFGGTVTGVGGDRLLVDDPHDPEGAESNTQREATLSEFDDYSTTRLDDPEKAAVVVVMQRLHDKDVSGHTLKEIGGYTHLCLPTEAEELQTLYFPLSGRQVIRDPLTDEFEVDFTNGILKAGCLLHPNRFGRDKVEEAKKTLGSYKYAGRHQQRPVPAGGGRIKYQWIQRYTIVPVNPKRIVQSWDTANKTAELNDPWCCTTWAEFNRCFYLLDVFTQRMEFPRGLSMVKSLAMGCEQKFGQSPAAILIEDKSSGQSIIQQLRSQGFKFNIIAITPKGDKQMRMDTETSAFESGRIFLPEQATWLPDYESELCSFPNSPHDDQIDSTSQFLNWVRSGQQVFQAAFG